MYYTAMVEAVFRRSGRTLKHETPLNDGVSSWATQPLGTAKDRSESPASANGASFSEHISPFQLACRDAKNWRTVLLGTMGQIVNTTAHPSSRNSFHIFESQTHWLKSEAVSSRPRTPWICEKLPGLPSKGFLRIVPQHSLRP